MRDQIKVERRHGESFFDVKPSHLATTGSKVLELAGLPVGLKHLVMSATFSRSWPSFSLHNPSSAAQG
jgi:hypothetical protein